MEVSGVGASDIPRLTEPTQSEFLSVFTSAHLADARQCFGVRQREGSRVERKIRGFESPSSLQPQYLPRLAWARVALVQKSGSL